MHTHLTCSDLKIERTQHSGLVNTTGSDPDGVHRDSMCRQFKTVINK